MLSTAAAVAYVLRQAVPTLSHAGDLSANILAGAWIIGFGWIAALALSGAYSMRLLPSGTELFRNVLRGSAAAAGVVGTVLYISGLELSRAFAIAFFLVAPPLLMAVRMLMRRVLNALRRRGHLRRRVLAIGGLPYVDSITRTLHRESWLGYEVVGAVVPHEDPRVTSRIGIPYLGSEDELLEIIRALRPSILLFTAGSSHSAEEFRRLAWELENDDLDLIVVPALSEISSDRISMRPVAGLPLVHMDLPRSRDALKRTKRVFDAVSSALGIFVLSPVLLACALAIKLHDGGPVIFRQVRVGRNGEEFEFLKFRSMVVDADSRLAQIRADNMDRDNDVLFKMENDPRITGPGRVLRRYSLDELPQLFNVLRGEMSLVGPRPALPREVNTYDYDARRRLAVRPGITGLWQVSGRSDLSWDETVRLDLYYVDNWSFTQDVQILFRTVRAVLASKGAY